MVTRRSLIALALVLIGITQAAPWWAGREERQIAAQVAALAQPGDIRMIASDGCGVCVTARAWFTRHGVAFSECSVERDAACRASLQAHQAPGTPLMLVRGKPQLGFNPERLRAALLPT